MPSASCYGKEPPPAILRNRREPRKSPERVWPQTVTAWNQYPFWRLQRDGIWEVSAADKIRLTASGDAFKRDLVDYDVRGGFTEEVAKQLQTDSKLASEIIQRMLDGHFPDTWHEDILQGVGIELTTKGTIRQKPRPQFSAEYPESIRVSMCRLRL